MVKSVVFFIHNKIIHLHPDQKYVLQDSLLVQAHEKQIPLKLISAFRLFFWLCLSPLIFIWHHCVTSACYLNSPITSSDWRENSIDRSAKKLFLNCLFWLHVLPSGPGFLLSHRRKSGDQYVQINGYNLSFPLPQQLFENFTLLISYLVLKSSLAIVTLYLSSSVLLDLL